MLALERSNIHQMVAGRNTQEPMMKRKEASKVIKEIFEQKGKKSSFDQYKAVGRILVTRDRVFALEGLAGTGKTTALAILREAAERQGFVVRGLAPTGRAADKLAESGIKTTTLQGFLKEPDFGPETSNNRRLYILDESSLSDTKNIHLFLKKAGPESRILLVGDPAQHQAVEAGAPFEQLIKAGIRTARLDKILRQRTNLKKPVELLSQREVLAAVTLLESQGRITEIKDDIERLKAIAIDYVNNPKGTLIISPANSERVAINSLIHHELQNRSAVGRENHRLAVLVNRQDMTGPERTFALAYMPGEDIIRYNTTSKLYGVKPGDYARVLANNHKDNTITVRFEGGREITYNPGRLSGVSVYREAERDFAAGDRIQFRAPFAAGKVKNSELGTIKQINDGEMTVRLDKKRDVTIALDQFRHLDHGYAVTSHSSQGQTVNRVLVNAETTETDALLNQRMAYVAISRARFEAHVYTDSIKELGPAFDREKNKEIALEALNESQGIAHAHRARDMESTHGSIDKVPLSQSETPLPWASSENGTNAVTDFAERMRQLNQRLILGEKFAATLNEKYSAERVKEVIDTRNVRRYLVLDQTTGLRRPMSLRDVEQRAMHVAGRIANEQVSARDGDRTANMYQWRELRDSEYAKQIERHDSTLEAILNAHTTEVRKLTNALHSGHQTNLRATTAAQAVESSSQANGQLPIPIIPHERLNELQLQAIRFRDVDAFESLEQIRSHLPHELGGPDRDTFSYVRLKGQAIVSDSNKRVAEKRMEDFEKSRHFAKFKIDGEQWSLVRVDREQRLAEREIEFHKSAISAYRWRLYGGFQNPWKLRNIREYRENATLAKEGIASAREEIKNLQPIRGEIRRLIEERRSELKESVREVSRLSATLNNAVEHETGLRLERGWDLPLSEFNSQELTSLEENSITLRDPHMLQIAQRAMELHYGHTPNGIQQISSRALGRAEAADVSLQAITERIESFNANRDFFPALFKGADGNERTATLHDLQPRTFTDKVFSYLSPADRLEINGVNEVLEKHYTHLLSERNLLEQYACCTREILRNYEQNLRRLDQRFPTNLERRMPPPAFTVREIAQVENFAARQGDVDIRAQFETIMRSSLKTGQADEMAPIAGPFQSQALGLGPDQIQATKDDYLELAKDIVGKVAANAGEELGTLNEAAVAAETDAASEVWVTLL